jgi:hypothetical protein
VDNSTAPINLLALADQAEKIRERARVLANRSDSATRSLFGYTRRAPQGPAVGDESKGLTPIPVSVRTIRSLDAIERILDDIEADVQLLAESCGANGSEDRVGGTQRLAATR